MLRQPLKTAVRKSRLWILCLLPLALCGLAEGANLERNRYELEFNIDFERSTFTGREVLHYLNQSSKPINTLFFHLYPNYPQEKKAKNHEKSTAQAPPGLQLQQVTMGGRPLKYEVERGLVKVMLPTAVLPRETAEVTIEFLGRVPQVTEEETSTLAHIMRELSSAAIREPATRYGHETFLRSGEMMILGYAYPVLAVQRGHKWQTEVPDTIADLEFAEIADYRARITTGRNLTVITSNADNSQPVVSGNQQSLTISGERMRNFVMVLGRNLRQAQTTVGDTRVRSIFRGKDASIGERMLKIAAQTIKVYSERFGAYPYAELDLIEAPLLPGHSQYAFSGLVLIASAYYLDFESPAAQQLPGFIREQGQTFEDGLEFIAAHAIAHQWWGEVVGTNPYRHSFLDEALAGLASVLYLEQTYNKDYAVQQVDTQIKAAYRVYRTFGGNDMEADRSPAEFYNEFNYAAIVQTKGTLFLLAVRDLIGEEQFTKSLSRYFENYRYRLATPDELLAEFSIELNKSEREALQRLYKRWLRERNGDTDIGSPLIQVSIGMGTNSPESRRNVFYHVGRFFLRIGKTAARPF